MGIETALLGAGLGLSVFGISESKRGAKREQRKQVAFDIRSAKLESKAILEEAALEAEEIKRSGELLGKKQAALTAKAGLKLGRGTARDIQEETKRLTEKDVATTLEAAQRKSEQLLTTFGAGTQEVIPQTELERLRKREAEFTALEEGSTTNSNNFIKSNQTNQPFFAGL